MVPLSHFIQRKVKKMTINKNITNVNHTAKKRAKNDIKYIVVHYVGALGDAKENTDFFKNVNRQASADFFIGFVRHSMAAHSIRNASMRIQLALNYV